MFTDHKYFQETKSEKRYIDMSAWNISKPSAAGDGGGGASSLAAIMRDQEFQASDLALAEALHYDAQEGAVGPYAPIEYCDADLALAIALQEEYAAALENSLQAHETQGGGNVRVMSQFEVDNSDIAKQDATEAAAQARVDVDDEYIMGDSEVTKAMRVHHQRRVVKGMEVGTRVSAKDARSTRNAVLDPATELIVFKLIQNGSLREMEGAAVKTGKEASVFHGLLDCADKTSAWLGHLEQPIAPGTSCAIKIFKTTLNEFSNRAAYFDGDHRFGKFNKAVSTREAIGKWAEKEFRNLIRVNTKSRLHAPTAIAHKEHVVIMTFIGENGIPAPQLKQLVREHFADSEWMSMYIDSVVVIYILMHQCHLVHGDLSEYNLLRGPDGHIYVIDFGQAVDVSHPEHFEYLVRDIETVNAYFQRQGVPVLPIDELMALCLQPIEEIAALQGSSSHSSHLGPCDDKISRGPTHPDDAASLVIQVPFYDEEGCHAPPLPSELPGPLQLSVTVLDIIRRIADIKL